jgi:hypothetical protein
MLSRIMSLVLVWAGCAYADPLPAAKFSYVEKGEIVKLDPGAWCYNAAANAILITAPSQERESCKLKAELNLLKERAKYDLGVKILESRMLSMTESHDGALGALRRENEKLTKLAMNRPASKSMWFTAGGFVAGVITTVAVYWLTSISR